MVAVFFDESNLVGFPKGAAMGGNGTNTRWNFGFSRPFFLAVFFSDGSGFAFLANTDES